MSKALVALTLAVWTALLFYLPTRYGEEELRQFRDVERATLAQFWRATRTGEATVLGLRLHELSSGMARVPNDTDAPTLPQIVSSVQGEMAAVNHRLFNNTYFRAVNALLTLAWFRCAVMLAWLPWLAPLSIAAIADGLAHRAIRARQAAPASPEVFGAACMGVLLLACGTPVAALLPTVIHPVLLPLSLVGIAALIGVATTWFHRGGR